MSCNVYADTGYTNADEMQDKARIVRAISKSIERRELSLADASKLVGLPAGRLRRILRGGSSDTRNRKCCSAAFANWASGSRSRCDHRA